MARVNLRVVVFVCLVGITFSEGAALTDLLRDKGVISTDEYKSISSWSSGAPAMKVGGRGMIDVAVYDSDDAEFSSSTEIRRARLFVTGKFPAGFFYKAQYDFVSSGSDAIRDLYLGSSFLIPFGTIRVGHFAEYGSLEDSTSSNYITFMERSLPVLVFEPAVRRIGVGVDLARGNWYMGTGLFGESASEDESERDGVGASARLTWAPYHSQDGSVHLGIHSGWRQPRGDNTVRFSARPEAHADDTKLIDTGAITNVDFRTTYGVEAACVFGPFSVQGEYIGVMVERAGFDSEQYDGFYILASWFLSGDSRAYDVSSGSFGRVKPEHPLGSGGTGAWELAARYSTVDLNDNLIGGEEENVTIGLNWQPTANTRVMLNYVNVSTTRGDADVDVEIVQMRTQFNF